jgi:hypothetical protein
MFEKESGRLLEEIIKITATQAIGQRVASWQGRLQQGQQLRTVL